MLSKARKEKIDDLDMKLELLRQSIEQEKKSLRERFVSTAGKPANLPLVFLFGCASGWILRKEALTEAVCALARSDLPWKELLAQFSESYTGTSDAVDPELVLQILQASQASKRGD
ncbi:MAG: hypothetical protein R3F50_09140 [Gammaproteobacteria bacterium]